MSPNNYSCKVYRWRDVSLRFLVWEFVMLWVRVLSFSIIPNQGILSSKRALKMLSKQLIVDYLNRDQAESEYGLTIAVWLFA